MSDKIVFLDYDGVLCHMFAAWVQEDVLEWDDNRFDTMVLKALAKAQREIGFKFVCCSRAHGESTKEKQEARFKSFGVHLEFHDDFRTPYGHSFTIEDYDDGKLYSHSSEIPSDGYDDYLVTGTPEEWMAKYRGFEILDWLQRHPEIKCDHYVILEDERDMYPIDRNNLILIKDGEMCSGFTFKHLELLYKHFKVDLV